jgi:hypothetical protein
MLKEYLLLILVGLIGACAQISGRAPSPEPRRRPPSDSLPA